MFSTYTGGCNTLNLQLAPNKPLEIRYNNSKGWDYTNPLLLLLERSDNPSKGNMIAGLITNSNKLFKEYSNLY